MRSAHSGSSWIGAGSLFGGAELAYEEGLAALGGEGPVLLLVEDLEQARVLEATRERYPPHYHVAIFPNQYAGYVEVLAGRTTSRTAEISYTVRSGDSLWTIARRHRTTVDEIRQANGLRGSTIYAGQILELPGSH